MRGREKLPRYEPSYLGEPSSDSNTTSSPQFYHENSHFGEPAGGPAYADAFEPAYDSLVGAGYYAHPPPHYTPQGSNSPGHHFDHSMHLPHMDSPHYDAHDIGENMMGHLSNRDRMPTDSSFSTVHSSPGDTGHYPISNPHMSSSPHLTHSPHIAGSVPPILIPAADRQAMLFDQTRNSPQLIYPQTGYRATDRDALNTGHPQSQSRQYMRQYRLHPYARDRRGHPTSIHSDGYTSSPAEAGPPLVDNSYSRQSDLDSGPMPPLSLAGVRAARPMETSYENTGAF
ncbi:hypothetical protein FRC12_025102 [Ceratobasidium sp. 428]|nr:hypothetical protein FRC12_025102 [Ceratobasidium sp. 428]